MLFALESAGGVLIPVNKNLQNNFVDEGKYIILLKKFVFSANFFAGSQSNQ